MFSRAVIIFFFPVLVFVSCAGDTASEKAIRSLDSLSGALNLKLSELSQLDTVTLKKALDTFENYRQFIVQNVNDTVTKEEGDHLQRFYSSGKKLRAFDENRRSILARGRLVNSQLGKLVSDLRNNAADESRLLVYLAQERSGAEEVVKSTLGQQQSFVSALEEFRMSVQGIETLIKSRNGGEMPTIIKESPAF